ncbi:unnamed protein product [Rhizoctonia solani]|uniref:Uncharacterized protein n=1 Tax=Rhizoctonia solani TaxID=456999 RepID=A0A8H3AAG3_9AGAM|nr:unnamed protein product [Rhizoctonia solani]
MREESLNYGLGLDCCTRWFECDYDPDKCTRPLDLLPPVVPRTCLVPKLSKSQPRMDDSIYEPTGVVLIPFAPSFAEPSPYSDFPTPFYAHAHRDVFRIIQAIKLSFVDDKRAQVGLPLIHYITLARVSSSHVRTEGILIVSGSLFVSKVPGDAPLVRDLAFAMKVDMTCTYDSPVPDDLRQTCEGYNIDVEACIRRNRKMKDARGEMWDLVIFVRVAIAIMTALREDTLGSLDESYRGHRPAGFKSKSKSKWLGLQVDESTPALRARDLPGAKAPRAVGIKTPSTSTSGPVLMSRKTTDGTSSSSSSGSSGSKSSTHKRCDAPRPIPGPPPSQFLLFLSDLDQN